MTAPEGILMFLWCLSFLPLLNCPFFINIDHISKSKKEEKTMATRIFSVGLAIASIFVLGIWFLGFVPQAMAETMNYKWFNHVISAEVLTIPLPMRFAYCVTIIPFFRIVEIAAL